mgnify:CR=1 FL=1
MLNNLPLRRRRDDQPGRFKRGVFLLPSMFTMANLFCGYACVVYSTQGDFDTAALFIGIAAGLALIVAAAGMSGVRAQAPRDSQGSPAVTFQVEVDYVDVDVVVTDEKGNFVRGLMRDDFEVFEDGKPITKEPVSSISPEVEVSSATLAATDADPRRARRRTCPMTASAKAVVERLTEEVWNRGDLDSYLIDITAQIFRKKDPDTGKPMLEVILDKAGQKGTGIWTLQSAIRQSVVISTINAAVEARVISSRKEERAAASKILPHPKVPKFTGDRGELITAVRDALYASKIVSYAQGMELLGAASQSFKWNLNFGDIATIWRGGCIIRAKFLNRIVEAYARDPALHNLLLDSYFTEIIRETQHNWRIAVATAIEQGVAVPAFSASLAYFDSYRQARLPSNLLQAQRDFFGAHTYERVDKPGIFHTEWMELEKHPTEKAAEPKPTSRTGE